MEESLAMTPVRTQFRHCSPFAQLETRIKSFRVELLMKNLFNSCICIGMTGVVERILIPQWLYRVNLAAKVESQRLRLLFMKEFFI
jgi:hypothetical protein